MSNIPTGKRCRKCGCTDEHACVTLDGPCYWAGEDICSACLDGAPPRITLADYELLAALPPMRVEIDIPQALSLLMVLRAGQACIRKQGHCVEVADDLVNMIAQHVGQVCPNLARHFGDAPVIEVEAERRIIFPWEA